jgi:beta-galactosidase
MAINAKLPKLWHGGDYNPDQWPEDVWPEDMRLMQLAGVNVVSVPIFSWASLEPADGQFEWGWFDRIMDHLCEAGVHVALATPSAAHPRWLSDKHPDVLAVHRDGRRLSHRCRVIFCPSSPELRSHVQRIDRALAERYSDRENVVLWHISNEYNTGDHSMCYCDRCQQAFREYLRRRYGDIETLNQQYWSAFWSQTFFSFDQINAPGKPGMEPLDGLSLDWKRFLSWQMADFFRCEIDAVREVSPELPLTTNLMGLYPGLNYAEFADLSDVISWDSYPDEGDPGYTSFLHALMRGLKDNRPWLLLEQTPSSTNWKEYHRLKPPGLMRLWSWQAIGCGSDSAMYFQWRRGRGGHEKFHGAVVAHVGHEDTRVFQEVAQLGREMDQVSDAVIGSAPAKARVGVLWDQENRWAVNGSVGPGKDKGIEKLATRHFKAIWGRKIPVDVVRMDADWSQYDLLIAPMLYMIRSNQFPKDEALGARRDEAAKLAEFVRGGGTLLATFLTGLVNESDQVYLGGYPGPLRELLGIWAEEIDNCPAGEATNRIVPEANFPLAGEKKDYTCDRYFDLIHAESAEVLARYGDNWYAGRPVLTKNTFGQGSAYYLASDADDAFLEAMYAALCSARGIEPLASGDGEVEVLQRDAADRRLLFVLNHAADARRVDLGQTSGTDLLTGERAGGALEIEGYGVRVIECE